jgi:hypothetical protein
VSTPDISAQDPTAQAAIAPVAHATVGDSGPNWQEQDDTLRKMWIANQSPAAIAKALGRSVPAIMTRAARLGLPRRFAPGRKRGTRPPETSRGVQTHSTARATVLAAESVENVPQLSMRICLMCLNKFQSQGRHNRICSTCKNSAEYESGSRLPDLDFPIGDA